MKDGRIGSVWDPSGTSGMISLVSYLKVWDMKSVGLGIRTIGGNDINFNTVALLKQNPLLQFQGTVWISDEMGLNYCEKRYHVR